MDFLHHLDFQRLSEDGIGGNRNLAHAKALDGLFPLQPYSGYFPHASAAAGLDASMGSLNDDGDTSTSGVDSMYSVPYHGDLDELGLVGGFGPGTPAWTKF